MSLSNLPPGVTQKMIDDYFAGPCPDCEEGNHADCDGQECRCDECEENARADAAEAAYEAWKDEQYEREFEEPDYGPED